MRRKTVEGFNTWVILICDMLRLTVCALLVISALFIIPSAAVGTDDPYTITIENGEVDVPERTVSVAGQEFTVSSIAPITPGEEINYQISASEDEPYRVVLYSDEKRIEAFNPKGDQPTFGTDNLDPGTYAMAVETGEIETIQPVVITSYETTLSVPSETDMGDAVSAEISIDEHTSVDRETVETVQVVIANGSINEAHTAEQTADGEYVADFDVEYTPGEYRVYAVVRGNGTVENGRADVIGMSEEQTLTITDGESGNDGSSAQDGSGSNDGDDSDTSDDSDSANTNGSEAGDTGAGVVQQTVIESDTGAGRSSALFESGSPVEEITFVNETRGSINITTRYSDPTNVDPSPGTTIQVSEITVPKNARNVQATIRLTISADRLEASEGTVDELRVHRLVDGTWERLTTRVIEEQSAHVTIEAETPGFSYFAVNVVSDNGADGVDNESGSGGDDSDGTSADGADNSSENGTTDNNTSDDSDSTSGDGTTGSSVTGATNDNSPGFGVLGSLVAIILLSVSLVAQARQSE